QDVLHIASLAIIISLISMLSNFINNYIFDIIEIKFGMQRSKRGIIIRALHALLFLLGLLIATIPLVAYILNIIFLS
ncbi:LysR family transcriptional regulator, partial [Francisella tularensis subsp. holarctica]|nr:LysR family transcriptional regulator [Francisella tularensis subsp. holarctica]